MQLISFPSNWRLDIDCGNETSHSFVCPLLINNQKSDYLIKVYDKSQYWALQQEKHLKSILGRSKYFLFAEEFYKDINGFDIGMKIKRAMCDFFGILNNENACHSLDKPFFLYQILLALKDLHSRSMVFLDLKYDNIVVDKLNGSYVFIKLIDHESTVLDGKYRNQNYSIAYSSPEFLSRRDISPAHDIWSLGIIAYSLYLNSHPFSNNWSKMEIQTKLRNPSTRFDPKQPEFIQLDNDVRDFISRCLEVDPRERATYKELLEHNLFKNHGISESFIDQQRECA